MSPPILTIFRVIRFWRPSCASNQKIVAPALGIETPANMRRPP
jgi:hypothetical protein